MLITSLRSFTSVNGSPPVIFTPRIRSSSFSLRITAANLSVSIRCSVFVPFAAQNRQFPGQYDTGHTES